MLIEVPIDLSVEYFYQYAGYPTYNPANKVYTGCCPICKEGKSWGKKKRLYLMVDGNYFHCHNCNQTWSALYWISQVSGKSISEIKDECLNHDYIPSLNLNSVEDKKENKNEYILPINCINLSNIFELNYYKNNKIVQDALSFIKNRRLDTAINKTGFFISLKDYIHKNRICIPFRDLDNKIIFYQTRALYKDDLEKAKYLSKINADKTVFGIEKVKMDFPYIFMFEGPINSMFVQNGVGLAGLSLTQTQSNQLNKFFLHDKIWVLDNQHVDEAARKKSRELVRKNEKVFMWPKQFKKYKDLNDLCIDLKKDSVNPDFFLKRIITTEIELDTNLI